MSEELKQAIGEAGPEMPQEGTEDAPSTPVVEEGPVSAEYHEATMAVLLALVPLLVFTLFGQIGLF